MSVQHPEKKALRLTSELFLRILNHANLKYKGLCCIWDNSIKGHLTFFKWGPAQLLWGQVDSIIAEHPLLFFLNMWYPTAINVFLLVFVSHFYQRFTTWHPCLKSYIFRSKVPSFSKQTGENVCIFMLIALCMPFLLFLNDENDEIRLCEPLIKRSGCTVSVYIHSSCLNIPSKATCRHCYFYGHV